MNKDKLNTIIKYLIAKGVTAEEFLDVFLETSESSEPKKEAASQKKPGRPKKANTKGTNKSAEAVYTVSDVCTKLNVKPAELKQMIADGDLPAPDNHGKWSQTILSRLF